MRHFRRAFTLIELLVVIAIIAILAAILFPVFAQAKAAAKTMATLSGTKQLMTSVLMYSNDYDDMTVYLDTNGDPDEGKPGHRQYAMERLYPYTKNNDIFYDVTTGENYLPHSMAGAADDPSDWGEWVRYHNLSFNAWGLFGYLNNSGVYQVTRSLSSQEDIAERAAITTVTWPGDGDPWGWYSFLNYWAMQPNFDDPTDFWRNEVYGSARRHKDGLVTAFADGHAKKVPVKRVTAPKGTSNVIGWYNVDPIKNYWGYWYSSTE